ncbi:MAG TPA: MFS transporter, partial [Allosphingosinicella sp.]
LYLIFAVVGTSSVTCAAVPYSKVASAWFQEKRGLVLGLFLGLGAGAGSAVISQVARVLIAELGWRDARLALSGLILLIPLPLMYFFLREPSHHAQGSGAASTARPAQSGMSSSEARRTRAFWMMFVMVFVGTVALAGTVIHMVAMLTDQGLSMAGATTVYSFYAIASIAGRVLIGWAQDKTESPKIGLSVYAAALTGLLMLRYGTTLPVLIPGAMLVGLGFGAQVSLAAYWVSRYWGLRCYGENYGYIYSAASAGAALGPLVMGAIFDFSGSYTLALTIFQGAMLFCGVMVCLMGDYVFSTRRAKAEPAETLQPSEASA